MTDLSPAAQAVDTALADCIQLQGEIIRARPLAAAALEAVAARGEYVEIVTAPGFIKIDAVLRVSDILAIAAELRGDNPTETP